MATDYTTINGKTFWQLIDQSHSAAKGKQDAQIAHLKTALTPYSPTALLSFITIYTDHIYRANQWHLWTASELINGKADEETFEAFRDWLISKGETTYKAALKDAESLVNVAEPGASTFADLRTVGREMFIAKMGSNPPFQVRHKPKRRGVKFEGKPEEAFPKLAAWLKQKG